MSVYVTIKFSILETFAVFAVIFIVDMNILPNIKENIHSKITYKIYNKQNV